MFIELREASRKSSIFYRKEGYYVVCTQGKRSGARRVRDYSRARRHRCNRCDALAGTQNRQHIQHDQQLPTVRRS